MTVYGNLSPAESVRHVTIWNRLECRKIAGNAAPLRRNLERYLERHPECEVYDGQDKMLGTATSGIDPKTGATIVFRNEHVPIWHKSELRKVTGNAAPLRKNLASYLAKHPECEEYVGQDKGITRNTVSRDVEVEMATTSELPPVHPQTEVHQEKPWQMQDNFTKSIPIPGSTSAVLQDQDMHMESFGTLSNSHDIAMLLNSPFTRSFDYDSVPVAHFDQPSPSMFLNSPPNATMMPSSAVNAS
mmetsp:Transcript_36583/g.146193  ORF Transcript_36583/g.146193 Transcript_36583/m.146193 type:complete len:244 (-) Transcript_36583:1160-1891(-)